MEKMELEYMTPMVEVVDINTQAIICTSGDYKATGQNGIWEEEE